MNPETRLMQRIQIAASRLGWRLFRNNVGLAWTGTPFRLKEPENTVLLKNARRVRFGLARGSPDLVGWKLVTITPDMVGQIVAVFAGLEIKQPGRNPAEVQENFIDTLNNAGGYGRVVRSVDDLPPQTENV